MELRSTHCCGVGEIQYLRDASSPANALLRLGSYRIGGYSHIIFIQATGSETERPYGRELAIFIRRNKLGSVSVSRPKMNPNSNSTITVYTWAINQGAVDAYFRRKK